MRALLSIATSLFLFLGPAFSQDRPERVHDVSTHLSMAIKPVAKDKIPGNVIPAACTGANTCCCRTGSQIFCTTPQQCSRSGGACSAGCN